MESVKNVDETLKHTLCAEVITLQFHECSLALSLATTTMIIIILYRKNDKRTEHLLRHLKIESVTKARCLHRQTQAETHDVVCGIDNTN